MGLDFSLADAHWSYSGFNEFRHRVAKSIHIDLDEMDGFGGSTPWKKVRNPLKYLLNHSDCDGKLTPHQCKLIAPELKRVIKSWNDADEGIEYHIENGLGLVAGMEQCADRKEALVFW